MTVVLLLGVTNPFSRWLWLNFEPLRYLRYPGNMGYLALPVLAALAAAGLHRLGEARRGRLAAAAALLIAGELALYGLNSQPHAPGDYFRQAGPLVRLLQSELGPHRFLLSPLALHRQIGEGRDFDSASMDFKQRLYGLGNAPYHLPAVANFGEPLVPRRSYDFLDLVYALPGPEELKSWLGWADASLLLTRDAFGPMKGYAYLGKSLWHAYRYEGAAARALWLDEKSGAALPAGLSKPPFPPERGKAVAYERRREDRYAVSGNFDAPGWLYLAEPLASGWRVSGPAGAPEPALGAFQKLRVPAGPWTLRFRYDPLPWRAGRALTVLLLCGLGAYWYNRLRRGRLFS